MATAWEYVSPATLLAIRECMPEIMQCLARHRCGAWSVQAKRGKETSTSFDSRPGRIEAADRSVPEDFEA